MGLFLHGIDVGGNATIRGLEFVIDGWEYVLSPVYGLPNDSPTICSPSHSLLTLLLTLHVRPRIYIQSTYQAYGSSIRPVVAIQAEKILGLTP